MEQRTKKELVLVGEYVKKQTQHRKKLLFLNIDNLGYQEKKLQIYLD